MIVWKSKYLLCESEFHHLISIWNLEIHFGDFFDINSIEYINSNVGYIDITDEGTAEITLEILVNICIQYTERDEDNSFYDDEEDAYLWEELVEYKEKHEVSFEATMILNIDELDEEKIEEKVNKSNKLLVETEFEESSLDIIVTAEPKTISIPKETIISMNGETLINREKIRSVVEDEDWDDQEYIVDDSYTTCPDCGMPISYKNDGGNVFCTNCAPKH